MPTDLLRVMAIMIEHPLVAIVPAALFLYLFHVSRAKLVLDTAILWFAYLPYEYGMKLRLLCSGECNIRVDLILLYPLLIALSVGSLVVAIWRRAS